MIIIYILLGLFSSIIAFLSFSPQFGKNPSKSQQELYSTFDNYKDGAFTNIEETVMITGEMPRGEFFKEVLRIFIQFKLLCFLVLSILSKIKSFFSNSFFLKLSYLITV